MPRSTLGSEGIHPLILHLNRVRLPLYITFRLLYTQVKLNKTESIDFMTGWTPELPPTFLRREKIPSSTVGKLEGGSFTRDFESWMKGALEVKRLSEGAL